MIICKHNIPAGTCYPCAQEEAAEVRNRLRIRFEFDETTLKPISPDEYRKWFTDHDEQRHG